jgi:hypothetical protein
MYQVLERALQVPVQWDDRQGRRKQVKVGGAQAFRGTLHPQVNSFSARQRNSCMSLKI